MYKSTIHGGLAPQRLAVANYRKLVTRQEDSVNKEDSSGTRISGGDKAMCITHYVHSLSLLLSL